MDLEADYQSWDKYILSLKDIKGLTDLERDRATTAFLFLRAVLGESFLRHAFQTNHPLVHTLCNFAPWTRKWLTWLADAMTAAESWGNYSELFSRIKQSEKYPEAISVLQIGYKLNQAGFNIAVDPAVKVFERMKVPDLGVYNSDTEETFYVEVSDIHQSDDEREASETAWKISEPLFATPGYQYYFAGKIGKVMAPRHLKDLVAKVGKLIERCQTEQGFHELVVQGELEVAVSSRADDSHFLQWLQAKGLKVGQLLGPAIEPNEIRRTKRKLWTEQKQLPSAAPNLVVLRNSRLFSFGGDFGDLIGRLEEEVFKYPHLLMAVIVGGYQGACQPSTLARGEHYFVQRAEIDFCVEQYMLLLNRYCDCKVNMNTVVKIQKAFCGVTAA